MIFQFENQSSGDVQRFTNDNVQCMQSQSSKINIYQHKISNDESINVGDISNGNNVYDRDDVYDTDCYDIDSSDQDNSDDNNIINDNNESNFDLGVSLASWSTKCNIPRDHVNQLLQILQQAGH